MLENSTMVILDDGAEWNKNFKVIAHWSKINVPQNQESIPLKVEEQAPKIKRDYLAWVHDLGRYKIGGQTLKSFLKLFDNLSFWWLTVIAAKSPFQSPKIYQVFKLRAVEMLYFEKGCKELVYCGHNRELHEIFRNWCVELGHPYRRVSDKRCVTKPRWTGIRRWASKFPFWTQALSHGIYRWFIHLRHHRPNSVKGMIESTKNDQVTIVTFFPNIDVEKTGKGRFWSHYWENLHDLLDDLSHTINWVWLYSKSDQASYKDSVFFRDCCNRVSPEKYRHFLLEEFLTPQIFFKTLKLYLKIYFKGLRLNEIRSAFCFSGSKLNFFPVIEYDWKSSFFGKDALQGVRLSLMFDSMAKNLPATPWSLFIWENQPWEMALISAWRRHRKGTKIIGFQHSTVQSMDLRLFLDPRAYRERGIDMFPLPDKLGLNGSVGQSLMEDFQYPNKIITQVEALRYLYLQNRYGSERKEIKFSGRALLVTTGITESDTHFQLELLHEAAEMGGLKDYEKVIIKPHPDLPVDEFMTVLKPNFNYTVVSQPLKELWSAVDVVYCSNSTTTPVEAAYLGVPLVITGPSDNFNLNPLFGSSLIRFVTNPVMLSEELRNPQRIDIPENYFYLDGKLNLWKALLRD